MIAFAFDRAVALLDLAVVVLGSLFFPSLFVVWTAVVSAILVGRARRVSTTRCGVPPGMQMGDPF